MTKKRTRTPGFDLFELSKRLFSSLPEDDKLPDNPIGFIDKKLGKYIFNIRRIDVIPDFIIASRLGMATRELNQNATRNPKRFPEPFKFKLTQEETEGLREDLRSLLVTANFRDTRSRIQVYSGEGIIQSFGLLRNPIAVERSVAMSKDLMDAYTMRAAKQKEIDLMPLLETKNDSIVMCNDIRQIKDFIKLHENDLNDDVEYTRSWKDDGGYEGHQWHRTRAISLRTAEFRCGFRLSPYCRFVANITHHINSVYYHPEIAYKQWNLFPACGPCHDLYHDLIKRNWESRIEREAFEEQLVELRMRLK